MPGFVAAAKRLVVFAIVLSQVAYLFFAVFASVSTIHDITSTSIDIIDTPNVVPKLTVLHVLQKEQEQDHVSNSSNSSTSTTHLDSLHIVQHHEHQHQDRANKLTLSTSTSNLPQVASASASASAIVDFEKQEGVVIAVKIHGNYKNTMAQIKQSLCLLTAAYNYRLGYDHLIFTTVALSDEDIHEMELIVAPAKLQVVVDSQPLFEKIMDLTQAQRDRLFRLCGTNNVTDYYWKMKCNGDNWGLGYNWQAEFRSIQIWTHPALMPYRTMLWFDSDAMCTEEWSIDPVATLMRNDLVILFDNVQFAAGRGRNDVIAQAFGGFDLCRIKIEPEGHLQAYTSEQLNRPNCRSSQLPPGNIHGFYHVTNLDWYRQPHILKWQQILFHDTTLVHVPNDQMAVTIPAAILAGNRSWDMNTKGIKHNVMHNGCMDGKVKTKREWRTMANFTKGRTGMWYLPWWEVFGKHTFHRARDTCSAIILNDG